MVLMSFRANHPFTFLLPLVSSISRVLRARFGKKDDEDDCDKKDEDGEKKTKHSIDGILGDKCKLTAESIWPLCIYVFYIIIIIIETDGSLIV